jgi:hypothetical protein
MHTQRKHLRAVPVSPTRGEQKDTANRSYPNTPLRRRKFPYGEMKSHLD